MILETADQRSDDWYAARCGKATASPSYWWRWRFRYRRSS